MAENDAYIALREECARCLLKAKNSNSGTDLWAWAFLSKSWLSLIDARRSAEEEPPPKRNIRTLAGRVAHA
jgi:hypothetical protein